jgi:hypothetical protein
MLNRIAVVKFEALIECPAANADYAVEYVDLEFAETVKLVTSELQLPNVVADR